MLCGEFHEVAKKLGRLMSLLEEQAINIVEDGHTYRATSAMSFERMTKFSEEFSACGLER